MKRKIKFSVYPLAVILVSLFVIVGCSDDDEVTPDNDIEFGAVTDIDGNEYKTVKIGDQEWMAENLRVTRYNNGDSIPTGLTSGSCWFEIGWHNTDQGAYAIFDYNHLDADGINSADEMVKTYGILYNWFTVVDHRGLCPEGWHVPSDYEWWLLFDYLKNYTDSTFNNTQSNGLGNSLKSCRQVNSPIGGDCNTSTHPRWNAHYEYFGTDDFGFSALPGGARYRNGNYEDIGNLGAWWSSDYYWNYPSNAYRRFIYNNYKEVFFDYYSKNSGFSVRCILTSDDIFFRNLISL